MPLLEPPPPGMMKMASGRIVPMSKPFSAVKSVVKKLLIAISYYEGDREAAEDLALLISQLERTRNREADILLVRRGDSREISAPVRQKLELKFDKVILHTCRRSDAKGYPHAPNQMFSDLVMLMAHSAPFNTDYFAWLNLETDAVPTRSGWIGEIIAEWRKVEADQKLAMGYMHDNPVVHLNGMAVYSPKLLKAVPQLIGSSPQVAYDIWHSKRVLPYAAPTPLIHFSYRQPTITPDELFAVRSGAVSPALFHGVKDRSARLAVRARYVTFTDAPKPAPTPPSFSPPENFGAAFPSLVGAGVTKEELKEAVSEAVKVALLPSIPPEPNTIVLGQTPLPVPVKRPNVYTYSHKHDGVTKAELAAILAAWTKGWTSRGWNPIVLTLRDAAKHPKFEEFQMALEKLPCVGDKKRMAHRFYRWLALDVAGGGLMTDFDVLPITFPLTATSTMVIADENEKMVGLLLSKQDSAQWISELMRYDAQPTDLLGDKPHVSDGTICDKDIQMFDFEHAVAAPDGSLKHITNTGTDRKSVAMERFLEGK